MSRGHHLHHCCSCKFDPVVKPLCTFPWWGAADASNFWQSPKRREILTLSLLQLQIFLGCTKTISQMPFCTLVHKHKNVFSITTYVHECAHTNTCPLTFQRHDFVWVTDKEASKRASICLQCAPDLLFIAPMFSNVGHVCFLFKQTLHVVTPPCMKYTHNYAYLAPILFHVFPQRFIFNGRKETKSILRQTEIQVNGACRTGMWKTSLGRISSLTIRQKQRLINILWHNACLALTHL